MGGRGKAGAAQAKTAAEPAASHGRARTIGAATARATDPNRTARTAPPREPAGAERDRAHATGTSAVGPHCSEPRDGSTAKTNSTAWQ
jgi:hypothetical protein